MAWNYYFEDRKGAQNGPVSLEELATLAKAGRIAADCLVWAEGGEPKPAAAFPELAAALAEFAAAAPAGAGPLQPSFPVWGLFWRAIVLVFGVALIIPAPWVGLWFYRWLAEQVALPGGRRLYLESSIGECWYIFGGMGLSEMIGPAFAESRYQGLGSLFSLILSVLLTVLLIQWFCRSLRAEQGGFSVSFEGGFWGYFGWVLLMVLSMFTVIGWAWVLKYQTRWICRNVVGSHSFEFVGTGLDFLWRSLVLVLALAFLIPFPWALRWMTEWFVSSIVARPLPVRAGAAHALAA